MFSPPTFRVAVLCVIAGLPLENLDGKLDHTPAQSLSIPSHPAFSDPTCNSSQFCGGLAGAHSHRLEYLGHSSAGTLHRPIYAGVDV